MRHLFEAVMNAVTTKVPAIRWVDFDLGQLDAVKQPPVSFPCVLVGFRGAGYSPLADVARVGELEMEVIVAFQLFERTHSVAQDTYRAEALGHLDTVEAVINALHGLDGTDFKALQHTTTQNDARADIRLWRLRFTCYHYPSLPEAGAGNGSNYIPWPSATPPNLCIQTI